MIQQLLHFFVSFSSNIKFCFWYLWVQVFGPMCDNCSVSKLFSGSLAGKEHKMFPVNSIVLM